MPIPQLTKKIRSPRSWKGEKAKKKSTAPRSASVRKRIGRFKKRRTLLLKLTLTSLLVFVVGGIIGLVGLFVWVANDLPDPNKLSERVLAQSTKIYDRTGENLLYEIHGEKKRTLVKLDDIPDYVKQATVAIEDKNFYQHEGFDIKRIVKAAFIDILKRRKAQGASTITQQLVKNAILSPEKTFTRKIKEVILAYQIERKFTKDEILQLYFNEIPYGSTAYGIEAAARTYFNKSVKDITLAEAAVLTALTKAPTYYSPFGPNKDKLIARQRLVIDTLAKEGYLPEDEAEKIKQQPLEFSSGLSNIEAPHFVLYVKEQLVEKYGERAVEQGGFKVYTTLDFDMQKAAEEAVNAYAEKNEKEWNATNASLVAIDTKTGQIVAMVGSRDFFNKDIDGQVNIALRSRQPGSSFKPIVYTAAFARGYLPQTVLFDVVTKFKTETGKDYEPKDYDLEERGPVSMRAALQGSLNIPAVKTIYLAGIDNVLDLADRLGYTTLKDRSRFGLSLVLGGGEIKLLEHTAAYATLSREGQKSPISSILKVEDANGTILEEWKDPKKEQVIDTPFVRLINDVLSDDEARSYVFGKGSLLTLPDRPVAAKTGTTNDYRDAWTLGYTPSLATGVWVGNNDNSEMKRGASGYQVAAPIWNAFMKKVLTGSPVETFNTPEEIQIDKPMVGGSIGIETKVKIDTISGKRATEFTPLHVVEEKIYRQIHSILFFVHKEDPRGPIPENPQNDPQYERWEEAVQRWAQENNIETEEKPPDEYDDIHIPENFPEIIIKKPNEGDVVTNPAPVEFFWNTRLPLKKINLFVDDVFLQELTTPLPNNYTGFLPLDDSFQSGQHSLKIVVYDEKENVALSFVLFNLE